MKTYRALTVVLAIAVVCLAYLLFSRKGKPAAEAPHDMEPTVATDKWHTNTMELWQTNTVERWHTNTLTETFTNEVVKEVPAKLSPAAREAAVAGYNYLHAPALATSAAFYKATPITLEVSLNAKPPSLFGGTEEAVSKEVEDVLRSRGVPLDKSSPHRLAVTVTPVWINSMPRLALVEFSFELKEQVVFQRGSNLVRGDGVLWSKAGSKLIRTSDPEMELKLTAHEQASSFCDDYEKSKQADVKTPSMPADFLPVE